MHRSENISEDSLAGETLLEDSDGGGGCAYHSRLLDYGYDMLVGENITRLFCFQGPCKWLPIEKSVTSIICGMILHGCGLGASLVGGFSDAHKSAVGLNSVIATLQLSEKHSNFRSWVGCPTPSTPMALCPVSGPLSLPWEHLLVSKLMH